MSMRDFITKLDDYNARVHAASKQVKALHEEREILRAQASDYMRLSQFDAEIARFTMPTFTFPDNFEPPAPTEQAGGQQDHPVIVRHDDKAAE